MSNTIAERVEALKTRRDALVASRGDAALDMFEGAEGADAALAGIDAEIAAADRELSTLQAAAQAAARRDAAAAAAAQEKVRQAARQRLATMAAERLELLRELCEATERFEGVLDRVLGTVAPIAEEMLTLGLKASATSALHKGEFDRRLGMMLTHRLDKYDLGFRKPSGAMRAGEEFAAWLAEEERLLRVQVMTQAGGSGSE